MDWQDTTTQTIEFGKLKKTKLNERTTWKVTYTTTCEVPAVYHRLVCQLVSEEAHGVKHNSHESRRRQMYARRVLTAFAQEIESQRHGEDIPPASFRSRILTPIIQRQLRAVHDAYLPSIHAAMLPKGAASLTISRATEIYLHEDPTPAYLIPRYRRYLLYVPEPRWHLGVVINPGRLEDPDFYNAVRQHHEQILLAIREEKMKGEEHAVRDSHGMPLLRRAEVRAIILEGLEDFFAQELSAVVTHPTIPIAIPVADHSPCRVN